MLNLKCILHPIDFSNTSQSTFHFACSLARDYSARVVVLHVVPLPAIGWLGTLPSAICGPTASDLMRQLSMQTVQDAWLMPSAPMARVTYADADVCESPCKKVTGLAQR